MYGVLWMRMLRARQRWCDTRGSRSALSFTSERFTQFACPGVSTMFDVSTVPRSRPAINPKIFKRAEHVILVQSLARAGRLF
jgi:hypothetical protein